MIHRLPSLPTPLVVSSADCRVRGELTLETVWLHNTVYPATPVWRVWFDGRPIVACATVALATAHGPLGYGMRFLQTKRLAPRSLAKPAHALEARFLARDKRVLAVTLRITGRHVCCAVRQVRGRLPATACSRTTFPPGALLLTHQATAVPSVDTADAAPEHPQVRFMPDGKLAAFWRHGLELHLRLFDRPGDLAEQRLGVLPRLDALPVTTGREGCAQLFLTLPFTQAALPPPRFAETLTPAYRAAFQTLITRDPACDAFWMMRGEPGAFAMGAQRRGGVWRVAAITDKAQTLTVRFEDLWLRTPPALRATRYTVAILRDPVGGESGPVGGESGPGVEESFALQPPGLRVVLDLAQAGGFLLTFRPDR